MLRMLIVLLLTPGYFAPVFATMADTVSSHYFPKLARQLKLTAPDLAMEEYEIRIWKKCQLCFGEAHELYRLQKKTSGLTVSKYVIRSSKRGFRGFTRLRPVKPVSDSLWTALLQQDILMLPDEKAIERQLRPVHKDSTYTTVEPDGSVSVRAKRKKPSVFVSDGDSYHVDVFGFHTYRGYTYSNPRSYLKFKSDIQELRKIVAILNGLEALFATSH